MEAVIFSYSMPNINRKTVEIQRLVVKKFNKSEHMHAHLEGTASPGDYMNYVFKEMVPKLVEKPEVVVFLDVDAIPLNDSALDYIVAKAKEGYLVGNAQRSNHIRNNQHIFIAPAVLAIRVDLYEKLGSPSFLPSYRGDVAEEVTYAAEQAGVPLHFLWPLSYEEAPAECAYWPLADGQPVYGRFTRFGLNGTQMFLHAFQIFHPGQQDKFIFHCARILNAGISKRDVPITTDHLKTLGMNHVRKILYPNGADDIYNLPNILERDMQGWASEAIILDELIQEHKPKLIIEVGTWKGGSAIHMANCCIQNNLDFHIICVDTWLGSSEHWNLSLDNSKYGDADESFTMPRKNGRPLLYEQFLSNVVHANLQDVITPVPMDSINAAVVLSKLGIKADLIHIDASHDRLSVIRDLNLYKELLNPGGVLVGDDYHDSEVRAAMMEVFGELPFSDNKFFWKKPL